MNIQKVYRRVQHKGLAANALVQTQQRIIRMKLTCTPLVLAGTSARCGSVLRAIQPESHQGGRKSTPRVLAAIVAALLFTVSAGEANGANTGLVRSVVNAPVAPNGNVARAVTDLVINLDRSLDPSIAGRGLMAGNKIRITLPFDFKNTGLPIASAFTGCAPNCSAAILLQGWPQHPIGLFSGSPGVGEWTVSSEGTHTIVIEALEDIIPAPPAEPGIKSIHLLLYGFRNPDAGYYDIMVEAEMGPYGGVETGVARVEIIPKAERSISVTSVFNGPPNLNTIYQTAARGELTALPYDFLMWGRPGTPLTGVTVVGPRFGPSPAATRLVQNGEVTVGEVTVLAPAGAAGYQVFTKSPESVEIASPLTGIPAARMTAFFRAGDLPGLYTVAFSLVGGNGVTMFVNVAGTSPTDMMPPESEQRFTRLSSTAEDPNGNSAARNCGGAYPDANATFHIVQHGSWSRVQITLKNAAPSTFYTVWLRLKGTDPKGVSFGGSPLTNGGSTPLAPSFELDELLETTGPGNGSDQVANGLLSDQNGDGQLNTMLDFPMFGGAYPFHDFDGFDPDDPRFPILEPRVFPVAIVTPNQTISAPFGLRIVSHCLDQIGHGLVPGAREPWFDWPE